MSDGRYPPGYESPHPTVLFYRGPGVPAEEHLQSHVFDFECPECKTAEDVIVLSSEWGVQIHSGDASGVFKAKCSRCGKEFGGGFQD